MITLWERFKFEDGTVLCVVKLRTDGDVRRALARGVDLETDTLDNRYWRLTYGPEGFDVKGPLSCLQGSAHPSD